MPILTGDDLRTYLRLGAGEPQDRLDLIADGVNDWAVRRTARDWVQTARTNEKYRGTGTKYLVVKHYPIVSLTALTVDDFALDVSNDDVVDIENPAQGIIIRTDGQLFAVADKRNIVVSYVGGPPGVPESLRLKCVDLAAWIFQTTGGRISVSDSGTSAAFANLVNQGLMALPLVKEMIDLHADILG